MNTVPEPRLLNRAARWNHSHHWFSSAVLIFLLAFCLRISFAAAVVEWNRYQSPEGISALPENIDGYEQIARNLIKGHGFSSDVEPDERKEFRLNLFRTPGYPVLLAGIKWTLGELRSPIFFANALLGAAVAALTFWLAYLLGIGRVGRWAGFLVALDPSSIIWSVYPRAEILLTALALTGFCLLVAGGQRLCRPEVKCLEPYLLLAGAGLAFGLAALTKPIAFYLVFAALPLLFWLCRKKTAKNEGTPKRNLGNGLMGAGIILVIWAILCGSWMIRNWVVTRHYSSDGRGSLLFSTIAYENLLAYRAAQILAWAENQPLGKVAGRLRDKAHSSTGSKNHSIEYAHDHLGADVAAYQKEAWQIIRAHPFLAARVQLQGMVRLFLGPGEQATLKLFGIGSISSSLNEMEQRGWGSSATADALSQKAVHGHGVARLMVLAIHWSWLILLYAAALVGLAHLYRARQWLALLLTLIGIFYFAGLAGGPEANSRFRVPIIPYVAVLAGCGLTFFYCAGQQVQDKRI